MFATDREGRQGTTAIKSVRTLLRRVQVEPETDECEEDKDPIRQTRRLARRIGFLGTSREIFAELLARDDSIDFRDAMIAGITSANGLTLVTRNKEHLLVSRNSKPSLGRHPLVWE